MRRLLLLPLLCCCLAACGGREPEPLIGLWREGAKWKYKCTHVVKDLEWTERWSVTKAIAGDELVVEGHDVLNTITNKRVERRVRIGAKDNWLKSYGSPKGEETIEAHGETFRCKIYQPVAAKFWLDARYPRLFVKQEWHDANGKLVFKRELIEFEN